MKSMNIMTKVNPFMLKYGWCPQNYRREMITCLDTCHQPVGNSFQSKCYGKSKHLDFKAFCSFQNNYLRMIEKLSLLINIVCTRVLKVPRGATLLGTWQNIFKFWRKQSYFASVRCWKELLAAGRSHLQHQTILLPFPWFHIVAKLSFQWFWG